MAKRSCLTSLQPIRIRAANAFSSRAFPIWPLLGPQNGTFYRGQFAIWPRALIIININTLKITLFFGGLFTVFPQDRMRNNNQNHARYTLQTKVSALLGCHSDHQQLNCRPVKSLYTNTCVEIKIFFL